MLQFPNDIFEVISVHSHEGCWALVGDVVDVLVVPDRSLQALFERVQVLGLLNLAELGERVQVYGQFFLFLIHRRSVRIIHIQKK